MAIRIRSSHCQDHRGGTVHEDRRWRLICYDVRDPKRYRKLYKIVRSYATPVQYSIFRARLDDREVERLRWELTEVTAEEDRLLIVDLCPSCADRIVSRNHLDDWVDPEHSFEVIS